eukprot:6321653-Amphidinium_carterae.1
MSRFLCSSCPPVHAALHLVRMVVQVLLMTAYLQLQTALLCTTTRANVTTMMIAGWGREVSASPACESAETSHACGSLTMPMYNVSWHCDTPRRCAMSCRRRHLRER